MRSAAKEENHISETAPIPYCFFTSWGSFCSRGQNHGLGGNFQRGRFLKEVDTVLRACAVRMRRNECSTPD